MDAVPALAVVDARFCAGDAAALAVAKTLSMSGNDFTVTDAATGAVVLRVDGVLFSLRRRCLLVDADRRPVLTVQESLKCENSDDPDQWVRFVHQQKGIKRKLTVGVEQFNRVKKEMTEEDIKNGLVSFDSRQKEITDFFQQYYKWDVLTARSIGVAGPVNQSPNILLDDTLLVEMDKNLLNAVKDSMVQTLRNDLRKKLVQLTFHQLVCSEDVYLPAMWLNSALMGYPIGPQGRGTVDEISTKLRGGCPSYFKESDYKYYLAVECLERASMTNNHDEGEILARDAFNLLTKITDYQRNLSDFYSHTTQSCFMKSILEGKYAAEERVMSEPAIV